MLHQVSSSKRTLPVATQRMIEVIKAGFLPSKDFNIIRDEMESIGITFNETPSLTSIANLFENGVVTADNLLAQMILPDGWSIHYFGREDYRRQMFFIKDSKNRLRVYLNYELLNHNGKYYLSDYETLTPYSIMYSEYCESRFDEKTGQYELYSAWIVDCFGQEVERVGSVYHAEDTEKQIHKLYHACEAALKKYPTKFED